MKYRFDEIAVNIKEKKKPTEEDRHHYIGLEHLDSGSLNVSRCGSDIAPKGEKLLMHKGDVLFGKRRAYQKKVAIAPFDGIFSAHGMVLRPNEEIIDKDFFPMLISSDYFLDAAIALSVGSLSPTINWRDLARKEFELPPIEKQRELADVLWSIEDTRTAYQELAEATEEIVKSRFIEMFGDPLTNPMGWTVDPLEKHLEVIGGYAFKSSGFGNVGIPVLRIGNINSGKFSKVNMVYWEKDENLSRYEIYPGDLVISLTGTVGKSDYGNVCIMGDDCPLYYLNQRNAKLSLFPTLSPQYLAEVMKFEAIKGKLTGISRGIRQANIANRDILNLEIPIPPIALQNQFADFVQLADKSKGTLQKSVDSLQKLKTESMHKYLS